MQIIDLYIRGGKKYNGVAYYPTQTSLIDTSATFLNGEYSVGQIVKDLRTGILGSIISIVSDSELEITGGSFIGSENPYQIYDDFTKLELFKDESVSITDSIQNVKDPSKIFAPLVFLHQKAIISFLNIITMLIFKTVLTLDIKAMGLFN